LARPGERRIPLVGVNNKSYFHGILVFWAALGLKGESMVRNDIYEGPDIYVGHTSMRRNDIYVRAAIYWKKDIYGGGRIVLSGKGTSMGKGHL
jgi:hypothetical protein